MLPLHARAERKDIILLKRAINLIMSRPIDDLFLNQDNVFYIGKLGDDV